jgi:hypothetical protein
MHNFSEFIRKYNIDNQLDCSVIATENILIVNTIDYRVTVYGWPDNRVCVEDKITGLNKIKRFGPTKTDKCENYLKSQLKLMGAEFPEEE